MQGERRANLSLAQKASPHPPSTSRNQRSNQGEERLYSLINAIDSCCLGFKVIQLGCRQDQGDFEDP